MKANIVPNAISVTASTRPDVGRKFLSFDIEGWDEVSKLSKKVLEYGGEYYTFTGWNSDKNQIYFARPINEDPTFAKFVK